MGTPLGKVEAYGLLYPKGAPRFAVELDCYQRNHLPADGGLGREKHFRNAWAQFWPEFQWNEWCDLMVWAWCKYKYITVIGHQRASKTYTFSHIAYLDYCSAGSETLTSLATVTFEGLRLRMWADLLRAIETSKVPNPFTVRSTTNECRVFPTEFAHEAGEKFQIHGMSVSRTHDAPGRIRGGHANRRIIILDEAQDMPEAIFDAMSNPMSAPFARSVKLSNPVEKVSKFGETCEPKDGWSTVDENDLWWETKHGDGQGVCLHFDGLQSPNIKAGRTIFPYLLTQESINEIESNHGKDSVQHWALVRGFFPPDGLSSRIFPSSTIERGKPVVRFDFQPQICATLDPAFEQDDCVMHFGQLAMPVFGGREYRINCTETLLCKIEVGQNAEPKDYQVAHWVIAECEKRGVQPKHFIMDRTGGGRGVFAILQKEWSREVQGVDYGGEASDRMLRGDDSRKCNVIYKYFVTELWFRASEYMKAGFIGGVANLHPKTIDDIASRRYALVQGTKGALMVAEMKKEVKKRLGRSPDYGDAFVQFGELLIRLGTIVGGKFAAQQPKTGTLWARQKEKVARLGERHDAAKEFAY